MKISVMMILRFLYAMFILQITQANNKEYDIPWIYCQLYVTFDTFSVKIVSYDNFALNYFSFLQIQQFCTTSSENSRAYVGMKFLQKVD